MQLCKHTTPSHPDDNDSLSYWTSIVNQMFHKLSLIPSANVFHATSNSCMLIVCQALCQCILSSVYKRAKQAPRFSDLLKWWVWTKNPGLSDAKAYVLCSAYSTFPLCKHLLTMQLYYNGWNKDGTCQRANHTCHHKAGCHSTTRGCLFEADIDLVPLQQPHVQVSLSYVPSPAELYLVSTYLIKTFSQCCA